MQELNTPSPINRVKVKGQEESNGEVMERGESGKSTKKHEASLRTG